MMCPQAKGCHRCPATPESGESLEYAPPHSHEGEQPCGRLDLGLLASRPPDCEVMNFFCLNHPVWELVI